MIIESHRIRELEAALELSESLLRKSRSYTKARDMKIAKAVKAAAVLLAHTNSLNFKQAIIGMDLPSIIAEVR